MSLKVINILTFQKTQNRKNNNYKSEEDTESG